MRTTTTVQVERIYSQTGTAAKAARTVSDRMNSAWMRANVHYPQDILSAARDSAHRAAAIDIECGRAADRNDVAEMKRLLAEAKQIVSDLRHIERAYSEDEDE